MKRSDHSMRPPTPATTLIYNSPNACNLCHTNKDAAWADKLVREWRKRDYQKPMLERAVLIAAARKQDWKKLPDILAYLSSPSREEIHTASLVRLLANCPADDKWPVFRKLSMDSSPLVRASVAEAMGERPDEANTVALATAAGDDYRLVRVRAANALASVPEDRLPEDQRPRVRSAMAELIDSISFGGFLAKLDRGARMTFLQKRVNDEVWLPSKMTARVEARLLVKHYSLAIETTWSNYRKFRVDSRVLAGEEPASRQR